MRESLAGQFLQLPSKTNELHATAIKLQWFSCTCHQKQQLSPNANGFHAVCPFSRFIRLVVVPFGRCAALSVWSCLVGKEQK